VERRGVIAGDARPQVKTFLLVVAAIALQTIVWAILMALFKAHVGYGLHDLSDVPHYLSVVERLARGDLPYIDVPFEYPPLALPVLLVAPRDGTLAAYEYWFSVEMIVVCSASAAVVTLTARRVWSGTGRPLAAAAVFAIAVAAAGALSLNRFDPVVGLLVALAVLALVHKRFTLAGAAVGLGFGVKLAPVVLLPLVLIMATGRRAVVLATAAALLAAALPFVPFIALDGGAFDAMAGYQGRRGLQIESLAATPYLVKTAIVPGSARVVVPGGGSLELEAWGTAALARASPFVVLSLLSLAYVSVWRARRVLRRDPEWMALAALTLLLALLCGNKVLSPQHLLWVLPLVALCTVARPVAQRVVGVLMLVAVALTQVEFPAHYHQLQRLEAAPIAVIAVRNVLLGAAFATAVLALWRAAREGSVEAAKDAASAQAEHPESLIGDHRGEHSRQ
jgi:hypothetical protein